MKQKIVVCGEFTNRKMKDLKERFDVVETFDNVALEKEIVDADALLTRNPQVDEAILSTATKLKLIAQATTGYNNLDVVACTKYNVQVCNSPQLNEEVADIALFHIINAMRKCTKSNDKLRKGDWYDNQSAGFEINHQNLLVVGYGRIGKTIAKKSRVLGVNLYATSPHFTEDDVNPEYTVKAISFEEGIKLADIIVLALPLNKKTHHIINKDVLKIMKNTSVLVNIARGDLVDSEALINALDEEEINYASCDVLEGEPFASDREELLVDNLYITPHIGSLTLATRDRMQQDAIENVFDYFDGKDTRFKVNSIK